MMKGKRIRLVFCGLILLLILYGCASQVEVAGSEAGDRTTAVPSTNTSTATPDPPTITPSAIPQPSEVPMHPEEPTPLPNEGVEIDFEGKMEGQPSLQSLVEPAVQAWIDLAKKDLGERLGLSVKEIELLSFEFKEWPDSSLGCPQSNMHYVPVTIEGYLITLQAGGQVYTYHGRDEQAPFLCQKPGLQPESALTTRPPFNIKKTPTKTVPPPRD